MAILSDYTKHRRFRLTFPDQDIFSHLEELGILGVVGFGITKNLRKRSMPVLFCFEIPFTVDQKEKF
jgi:hypothetical protein